MRRRAKVWSVLAAAAFAGSAVGVAECDHRTARLDRAGGHRSGGDRGGGHRGGARRRLRPKARAGDHGVVPPERGDADLVIWTDDTRQPVVEEIADTFAEENGITVAVQELRVRRDPRAAQPRRAGRRGARHRHRRPRLARRARRQRRRRAARPLGVADDFQDGRHRGVHVRRPDLRPALRGREHRPRAQHRPRARGAGDVRGDDRRSPPTTRPSTPTTRRTTASPCRSDRRATPTTCSRSCRRSAATSSARTRTARSTPTTSASTPRAASRRRRSWRAGRGRAAQRRRRPTT